MAKMPDLEVRITFPELLRSPVETVTEAILNHDNLSHGEGGPFSWGPHSDHIFSAFCAVCRGDVPTLARWAVEALSPTAELVKSETVADPEAKPAL